MWSATRAGGQTAGIFCTTLAAGSMSGGGRRPRSNAAAFRRTAAVMRDRRHVADRGDREADRLQRAQCRFTPRARALDLDVEGAHAMLHGLTAGILGGDLPRVG